MQTTTSPSWQALAYHAQELKNTIMKELFACDGQRFEAMSIEAAGILCDFSKNLMTEKTLDLLLQFARECDLSGWIERMFSGERINTTENRPVLHTALRKRSKSALLVDGQDVMPGVCRAFFENAQLFQKRCAAGPGQAIREGPLPIL